MRSAVTFDVMQTTGPFESSFLASNASPPEDGFFQGYCFVGTDLVFGTEGAQLFQAATGNTVPAGQDGCYVTVKRDGNSYIFDVDYSGFTVLYYYHDGTTWIVSNSFSRVVDFLRENGLRVRPNYAHIAAANGRRMALGQLFSLETMAHGVQVAPRTHSLIVSPNGIDFVRRFTPSENSGRYDESLSEYLETWISRFETLMESPKADFTVDLTGGVDSRTNFAILRAAMKRLGTDTTPPRLRCASGPGNREDFDVAKRIARHYGLELNDRREMQRIHLNAKESFQVYRDQSLGVYFPFYRPTQAPTPRNITIGGGGGGIHRNTYEQIMKSPDPDVFFKQNARHLKRPEFEEQFICDGQRFLSTTCLPDEDPLRVLLREGRVRYHSGRTPRSEVAFTPLHSISADRVQELAGAERSRSGQLNYDIMHSVDPALMEMPYDDISKAPTQAIRNSLVSATLRSEPGPGRVWAPDLGPTPPTTEYENSAFKNALDAALANPFVRKFWGTGLTREAKELMEVIENGGSIGNAANGIPIAAILSTDLVTPA